MDEPDRSALLAACRVLFGHELDPPFLTYLRESGLRTAWRRKALETHPDRTLDRAAKSGKAEAFIEARRAYGLLQEFLARRRHAREPGAPRNPHPAAARRQPHRPESASSPCGPRGPGRPEPDVPGRRLRLGEFLYHAGVIPYPALIEALVWQRRQRDRFGDVGRRWGLLSEADVTHVLSGRHPHERVGTAAQRLRLLTAFQVRAVLAFQRSRQEPIGAFFVRSGMLTHVRLDQLLRRHEEHNRSAPRG